MHDMFVPRSRYEHDWVAGDLLLFDNRRMLHSTPSYVPVKRTFPHSCCSFCLYSGVLGTNCVSNMARDGPAAAEQLLHHVSYQAAFTDAFAHCAMLLLSFGSN